MEFLLHDGDQHVGGDGAPDLCLPGVLAGPDESLDAQVLLDPFEPEAGAEGHFAVGEARRARPTQGRVSNNSTCQRCL